MQPVILTDGVLVLRPPRAQDADAVLRVCQDPEIGRWTSVPTPYTRADADQWVQIEAPAGWASASHLCWCVSTVEDPATLLASIGLHHLDLETHGGEIGYWTAPEARGRGIITDAVRIVARWAFDELSLERIEWEAGVGNTASRRVAEKVGFTIEGTARQRLALHGLRQDSWLGGLLPDDLAALPRPITATPIEPGPPREKATDDAVAPPLPDSVEITAGALHLRPFRAEDAPGIATNIVDPATALWNPFDRTGTPAEDAQRYLERFANVPEGSSNASNNKGTGKPRDFVQFAIADATSGDLLGAVVLNHIDPEHTSAELGYWTVPAARGQGVAQRGVGSASRWAFAVLGLERLELWHAVENDASCQVAEACGFTLELTTRRTYRYGDGERHDEHLHARLATDPAADSTTDREAS